MTYITIIIFVIIIVFLIKKKKNKPEIKNEIITVTTEKIDNNTTQISFNLNDKELIKRLKNGDLNSQKDTFEETIMDITGFYGLEKYSENKEYCVTRSSGYGNNEKWKNGKIALLKNRTLLFKKEIQRPNKCYVSNSGIVICSDYELSESLNSVFYIFEKSGELIFKKKTTAIIGECSISKNSKIAIFETASSDTEDGDQMFIIDIERRELIKKFDCPCYFSDVNIDTENKRIRLFEGKFIYEIDFEGQQTNLKDYENQILAKGTISDKLWFFEKKPEKLRLNDESYLNILLQALIDKRTYESYGKDLIYRKIGEYYEFNNDFKNTIENWEKAIQINPKIGLKRKLISLKKKI